MKKSFVTVALALAMSVIAVDLSFAQSQAGRMMGMAGGGCPMMGMMGQGMMGQGMMGQGPMGQGPMGQGRMAGSQEMMGAIAESRLTQLKVELKITDAQADVWKAYADAIKARADVMQGMRTSMMDAMDKGGAIERMDIRIRSMEAMVESMKAVKPATEKLYAALTADQRKVADQLIGVDCGAM
jgi:hypothetical protein